MRAACAALFVGLVLGLEGRALADEPESDTFVIGATSTAAEAAKKNDGELNLRELVEEALRNNRRIKIDRVRIGEARALLSLAQAQAYPRVDALALGGGPTPERKTLEVNKLDTLTEDSKLGNLRFGKVGVTFQLNATAVLPLYTFGKISSAKEAARAAIRAAEDKAVITEADVVLDVHRAFWGHQLARSFLGSLQDGEKTLLKVQKRIEELLDAESPQVTENDRLRMIHAIATVRVRANEAETATRFTLQAIKLLIGRDQDSELEVASADLDELPPDIPKLETFLRAAQESRPEILALRNLVAATTKFAEFRKNRLWPDVFLGGGLNYAYTSNATDQTNPFIYDPYNYFGAGVGLGMRFELDVFTKVAELEQAEAEAATHGAETSAVEQAVDLEVRKIHMDLTSGYQRIRLLERANRAARGWLTASTLAYDIGTGDARQLTEAFLAWAASEAELQKTRFDMHIAHADYARAAGQLIHRKHR
jgi:outer membrane protein, multidrug efflux system